MPIDPGDHAELAILIRREHSAQAKRETVLDDLELWVERGKLAKAKGELDLARQALERALTAKTSLEAVDLELETIRMAKDVLKRNARKPDESEAVIRAEVLVEQFRMQGLAPEEQELREMAEEVEAELALEELSAETEVDGDLPFPPLE